MQTPQSMPLWRRMKRSGGISADAVLGYFGVAEPPVDVERIALGLGVRIHRRRLPSNSGMVDSRSEPVVITVNEADALVRQRFTLAHELGHLLLHPERIALRDHGFSGDAREVEANRFAADILMPLWMLDEAAEAYGARVDVLASVFQVSEAAMRIRLRKLVGIG